MPTERSCCPAPGCGRLVRGDRCECGWSAAGAPSESAEGERRPCPDCAELVLVAARVCRFCGADLECAGRRLRRAARSSDRLRRGGGRRGRVAAGPSAPIAAVLSFVFVGAGQIYCGDVVRAGAFFAGALGAAGAGFALAVVTREPAIAWLLPSVAWMWSIVDAYSLASRPRR